MLATVAVAAFLGTPGGWASEPRDEIPPSESGQQGEAVPFRVSDMEPEDVQLAELQPPLFDPETTVPGGRTPRPRAPSGSSRPSRAEAVPPENLLAAYTARPRRTLATVPHMFGDFFGGGGGQAIVTVPPISVLVTDGPFDLFVTNPGVPPHGANLNPTVPITVLNGPGGQVVTTSIGNGSDHSGDGQPDSYPVQAPNLPGVVAPPVPWPGTLVYTDGHAIYTQGTPAPGSVGQADGWALSANYVLNPNRFVVNVPYGGGAVRRVKIAENDSPQPRDRLIFSYNFFNDVIGGMGDVSQYTIGLEHTLGSSASSVEVRLPFAGTLDNEQTIGAAGGRDLVFGNLALAFKTVLYEIPTGLISAGLGVTIPTSPAARVSVGQTPILEIENRTVHLAPFLAAMSRPSPQCFWQAFVQLDVDPAGNRVRGDLTGVNLTQFGVLHDSPLLFADVGVGYLLYENPDAPVITGIAPMAELHYSTTLQDADVVAGNGFVVQSFTQRFDVLNLTLGTTVVLHDRLSVRPAMVIPLRDGHDKHFDYEAVVQVNWQL